MEILYPCLANRVIELCNGKEDCDKLVNGEKLYEARLRSLKLDGDFDETR